MNGGKTWKSLSTPPMETIMTFGKTQTIYHHDLIQANDGGATYQPKMMERELVSRSLNQT